MSVLKTVGSRIAPYRWKRDGMPDISALKMRTRWGCPWMAEIEWPLPIDAPSTAQPWCCYLDTVILYEQPYRVVEGDYAEFGRCNTPLRLDDVLEHDGRQWLVHRGAVAWTKGRWHMVWTLRRLEPDRELHVVDFEATPEEAVVIGWDLGK